VATQTKEKVFTPCCLWTPHLRECWRGGGGTVFAGGQREQEICSQPIALGGGGKGEGLIPCGSDYCKITLIKSRDNRELDPPSQKGKIRRHRFRHQVGWEKSSFSMAVLIGETPTGKKVSSTKGAAGCAIFSLREGYRHDLILYSKGNF